MKVFVCLALAITACHCIQFNKTEMRVVQEYMKDIYEKNPTDTRDKKWFNTNTDSYGYVAYDRYRNNIAVAFRGTVTPKNVENIWKLKQVPYLRCNGCTVHEGFFETYESSKQFVIDTVQKFYSEHPTANLYVTGFSLGGGQAVLCAVDLYNVGFKPNLLTFGSPRPGNKQFADYTNHLLLGVLNFRVTYASDAVAVLPLKLLGYKQVGTNVNFKRNGVDYTIERPFSDKVYNFRPYNLIDHNKQKYLSLN